MDAVVIESEALKLSVAERVLLIDQLQSSLTGPQIKYESEHLAEARERFEAYKEGEIQSLDGDAVVSRLRSLV